VKRFSAINSDGRIKWAPKTLSYCTLDRKE
jgi:hypothetical protein